MANNATIKPAAGAMPFGDKNYTVTAVIHTTDGRTVPVLDIPVMTDETWHKLAGRRRSDV